MRRPFVVVALGGTATGVLLVAVSFGAFGSSAQLPMLGLDMVVQEEGESADTAETVRWGNVVVRVPEDSTVGISRESLPKEENPPDGGLVLNLEKPPSRLIISAETGSVLYDSVIEEDRATFNEITATIVVGATDQGSLGWPYAPDASPGPRETWGNLTLNIPDPSSGIELYGTNPYGGAPFIRASNGRSRLFIDAQSGAVLKDSTVILPKDLEAFERFLATVEVGNE